MDEKIFQIILASIPVFGAIITGFIIPFIKEKIGAEKLAKYEYWTSMAVKCAEMMFKEQGMGEAKKEYEKRIERRASIIDREWERNASHMSKNMMTTALFGDLSSGSGGGI